MIFLVYLISVLLFYLAYLIFSVIFGRLAILIKGAVRKSKAELEGFTLLSVAFCTTFLSFTCVDLNFRLFGFQANWFIVTPLMIIVWFYITPNLYRPHFQSGAGHWGTLISVISFLILNNLYF